MASVLPQRNSWTFQYWIMNVELDRRGWWRSRKVREGILRHEAAIDAELKGTKTGKKEHELKEEIQRLQRKLLESHIGQNPDGGEQTKALPPPKP